MILELISPGRYQGEDVGSATAATAAAAGPACGGQQEYILGECAGSCSSGAAALEAEAQAARLAKAAAEVSTVCGGEGLACGREGGFVRKGNTCWPGVSSSSSSNGATSFETEGHPARFEQSAAG